jgi:TolA-binding protein
LQTEKTYVSHGNKLQSNDSTPMTKMTTETNATCIQTQKQMLENQMKGTVKRTSEHIETKNRQQKKKKQKKERQKKRV